MKLNTILYYKYNEIQPRPYEVGKVIEISDEEFRQLCAAPLKDRDYIKENQESMFYDESENIQNCLMILNKETGDGALVNSEGYDYARYIGFIPNARSVLGLDRPQCLRDYEKALNDAADELISCAKDYQEPYPYRALIEDICDEHDLGTGSISLLGDLIQERDPDINVDIFNEEITLYTNTQRNAVKNSMLPYSAERTSHLLDNVLDWIGENERGAELYDTLKNTVGMSDEEISAAGFETLEQYFQSNEDEIETMSEDESPGMTMQ